MLFVKIIVLYMIKAYCKKGNVDFISIAILLQYGRKVRKGKKAHLNRDKVRLFYDCSCILRDVLSGNLGRSAIFRNILRLLLALFWLELGSICIPNKSQKELQFRSKL